MRKLWRILFSMVLMGAIFITYKFFTFELLPVEKTSLTEIIDKRGNVYSIFKVAGNATTDDVLQLVKYAGSSREVIFIIEGYDTLQSIQILNDSLIELTLSKEGYQYFALDTLIINILTKETLKD